MRLRINFLVVCLFMAGFVHTLKGQTKQSMPVTPEAAALAKMVNYPISFNTGVPDINIPFYKIQVGGIALPIKFDYHAGGFRINEQSTRIGLGWSLSADLQISRSINGLDDFLPGTGYIANSLMKAYYAGSGCSSCAYPLWSSSPFPYANEYDLATNAKDGMPDKFNYKLLNKSGSFYFLKNTLGTDYTIVPVPFDNIKITYNNGQFIIVDTDGTTYYFGEQGAANLDDLAAGGKEVSGSISVTGTCIDCHVTAWKCKQIENSTGTDELTFTYTPKTISRYRTYNDYIEYYSNSDPCGMNAYYRSDQSPINDASTYEQLLDRVPFYQISTPKYLEVLGNNAQSNFHVPYMDAYDNLVDKVYTKTESTNGSTMDVSGLSLSEISFRGGKVQFNGADKLGSIRVLDSKNTEIKSVYFFQSYSPPDYEEEARIYNGSNFQGTMYLDSLHMQNGSTAFERYALLYSEKFCYGNHLKGHDAWGYMNDRTEDMAWANTPGFDYSAIPSKDLIQDRYYYDIYGGCTNYISDVPVHIDGDDWAEAPNEDMMRAGILQRIVYPTGGFVDFDFEANKYLENFSSDDVSKRLPQLAGGLRIRSISYYDAGALYPTSQKYYRYGDLEDGTGILINRPRLSLDPNVYHFDAVGYRQQMAYLGGPTGILCDNRGCLHVEALEDKTTFHPASFLDYTYGNGAPIYYTKVTEYQQDLGVQTGKTVYEYYPPDEFQTWPAPLISENRIEDTNLPYMKTDGLMGAQKSVSTYKYDPVAGYQLVHRKSFEYTRFLKAEQVHVAYAFFHVLYQVVEGAYSGSGQDLYDNNYSILNDGDLEDEYIAGEYGIPVGKLLLSKETDESLDAAFNIFTTVNNYYYDNPDYIQPSRIVTTDSKGRTVTKTLKYPYDFDGIYDQMEAKNMISQPVEEYEANTTTGQEISRNKTNYAEIAEGAGFIAPVSVQSSTGGQLLVTDVAYDKYDQYGNVLQLTGRDGVPVSYLWGYEGLYPVAVLKGTKYADIPASYTSNAQITDPSDDNSLRTVLAGLRNSFSGIGQINTYTYKRSVGMTSYTATNGYADFYEYDPFGRLTTVKDNNQNIVKTNEYRTKGPSPSSLELWYVNVPMMQTHNRDCSGDSTPLYQIYNYIVPGGRYSDWSVESANLSAEDDLQDEYYPPELPTCPTVDTTATLELEGIYFPVNNYPSKVDIDFIQNGTVMATQTFPFNDGNTSDHNVEVLHLPPGEYQLSFRPSADTHYTGDFLSYTFIPVEDNYVLSPESGDWVTIEKNKHYKILVVNAPW